MEALTIHPVTFEGLTYTITSPDAPSLSKTLAAGKPYELPALRDMRQHAKGTLAVDAGAHVGNHSVWLALFAGMNVLAFEPDQDLFTCLLQNVKDNNLPHRIVSHGYALSDREGCVQHLGRGRWEHAEHGTRTRRLDDHDLTGLGLLKIDVEGMEPLVLKGALGAIEFYRPVIYAESRSGDRQIAGKILAPFGYRCAARFGSTPLFRWDP